MADVFSKEKRSEIMSKIRARNTRLEQEFLKRLSAELYPKGYRYRKHYSLLPGKPDVVFVKQKVAVFVDGDFWHGWNLMKHEEKPPRKYWLPKIQRNIQRDVEIGRKLRRKGWKVLRFWEHEVKKAPEKVVRKIERILQQA